MAFVLHHIPLQINLYVLTFARMSDMTLSLLSAFHFLEHVFFKKKNSENQDIIFSTLFTLNLNFLCNFVLTQMDECTVYRNISSNYTIGKTWKCCVITLVALSPV